MKVSKYILGPDGVLTIDRENEDGVLMWGGPMHGKFTTYPNSRRVIECVEQEHRRLLVDPGDGLPWSDHSDDEQKRTIYTCKRVAWALPPTMEQVGAWEDGDAFATRFPLTLARMSFHVFVHETADEAEVFGAMNLLMWMAGFPRYTPPTRRRAPKPTRR